MRIRWVVAALLLIAVAVAVAVTTHFVSSLSARWLTVAWVVIALVYGVVFVRRWLMRPLPILDQSHAVRSDLEPRDAPEATIPYKHRTVAIDLVTSVFMFLLFVPAAASLWHKGDRPSAILAVLVALGGALLAIRFTRILSPSRYGATIDHRGITFGGPLIPATRVLWTEITAMHSELIGMSRYSRSRTVVALDLVDTRAYIERQTPWTRLYLWWRWKTAVCPIRIDAEDLAIDRENLVHLLESHATPAVDTSGLY